MQSNLLEILQQWKKEEIQLNTGASADLIGRAEAVTGFVFPEEFKRLYMEADGFRNFGWSKNMFSVWPLERIIDEYNNGGSTNFIGFADYLINSHTIGFLKTQTGIFKYYGTGEYTRIASSFFEAIKSINSNADIIY